MVVSTAVNGANQLDRSWPADQRGVEIIEQAAIPVEITLLVHGLLQEANTSDRLDQVRRETAAAFGDPAPVPLRDALEDGGGAEKYGHDTGKTKKETWGDGPEENARHGKAQNGREQLRRALNQERLKHVDISIGAGNDPARLGSIKVANTESLHMSEDTDAQAV